MTSKFQLPGVRRFGGDREQTNKQTDSLTDRCFDREIEFINKILDKFLVYASKSGLQSIL